MSEKRGSFEDSEAQSFISSGDSDVTAGWGSTKHELEKSHSRTIRLYRIALGLLVSLYIVSVAFVAWRERSTVGPLLFQQKFLGDIPKVITVFHNDDEYVEGKFNGVWGEYMVPGGGEVVVPEPGRWNLTGGLPAPEAAKLQYGSETEFYMISVFHQMHCFLSIKENYDMTNHVLDSQDLSLESEKSRKYRKEDPTHEHLNHCFAYLRQSLLCSADTTLEPAKVQNGVRIGEYTGWELGRECKDWNAIAEFATRHQYNPWATESGHDDGPLV